MVGKLPSPTIEQLIQQILKDRFLILPISNKHISSYTSIPLHAKHKDPFDRLLLATALSENIPVISTDEDFRLYALQVNIIEA